MCCSNLHFIISLFLTMSSLLACTPPPRMPLSRAQRWPSRAPPLTLARASASAGSDLCGGWRCREARQRSWS
uniref:Secreted protein n=1 Tax=Arundo donax TaxID=35708 RepID=A0A0A9CIV5_ARUDO